MTDLYAESVRNLIDAAELLARANLALTFAVALGDPATIDSAAGSLARAAAAVHIEAHHVAQIRRRLDEVRP